MSKVQNDPIDIVCCACDRKMRTNDVFSTGWSLHETHDGRRVDLCKTCHDRQDGREEQERQILGLPARKISEIKSNEPVEIIVHKEVFKPVSRETKSGVTVQAVFKLVRINVKVGDNIIKGKELTSDACELTDKVSGSDMVKGKTYFINLT